jgi:hypothetical protein
MFDWLYQCVKNTFSVHLNKLCIKEKTEQDIVLSETMIRD